MSDYFCVFNLDIVFIWKKKEVGMCFTCIFVFGLAHWKYFNINEQRIDKLVKEQNNENVVISIF